MQAWSARKAAAEALGKSGDKRAVEPLIASLKDQDTGLQKAATEALGRLGDGRAVEPLIACLKNYDPDVRNSAAEALGKLGDARAVGPLIVCFKEGYLREASTDALSKLGDAALEPLLECLKTVDPEVRKFAAKTLGILGDARAVEALIACLQDQDAGVRLTGAESLGKIGERRAVEPLIACLQDQDSSVRLRAIESLSKMDDARSVEPFIACLKDGVLRDSAREALRRLGAVAVEKLIGCLKDTDSQIRSNAAIVLGKIGDKRAVQSLIACPKDQDEWFQIHVAGALIELGDERGVDALIACLKCKDEEVRYFAAKETGELHDARAVEPLIVCLKAEDSNRRTREIVAEALSNIGSDRALAGLVEDLPDWDVREQLFRSFEKLHWKPTSDNEQVYYWICSSDAKNLKMSWEKTSKVLLVDIQSENQRKIENAAYTFMSLGILDKEITPKMISALYSHGTVPMAQTYLNCGKHDLVDAARSWATDHGYQILDYGGYTQANFGQW